MNSEALFYRDTWAEVDIDRISANVSHLRERLPEHVQILAVVKANAYGHGDEQVAKAAIRSGATQLAVAFLDEALALRKKGIQAPILVLGASRPEDVTIAARNHIMLTVLASEWLEQALGMLDVGEQIGIHIKLDSGMGRIGVRSIEELKRIEQLLEAHPNVRFEGVFTHFATADELDRSYFNQQLSRFRDMLTVLETLPPLIHASNSAAALLATDAHFNGVRYGIGMYGLTPSLEIESHLPFPLEEAFSLHSKLIHVKKLHKGEKVSYGATYTADEDQWIGTIPIGYADGWLRGLQGQDVLVAGVRAPIVGRICMDQCMIRLPYELPVGTQVTLIGEQGEARISTNEVAQKLGTINYEIPCIISSRVPRLYKKSGKLVDFTNVLLQL